MGLAIDILCTDGSQLGCSMRTMLGDDPDQIGTGGSETGLFTLLEAFVDAGHAVTLYNNPRPGWWSVFDQKSIKEFRPEDDRDVLIIFRTPNDIVAASKGYKVWMSCDQYTSRPFNGFNLRVDKTVCISPFHQDYFKEKYGISDAVYIDLPIRVKDFGGVVDKKPNSFISNSVPSRGLDNLFSLWPKLQQSIPDANLVVTSDYRLWGADRRDEQFIGRSLSLSNIRYSGALKRPKYIEKLMQAEVMIYPCNYQELQCLAVCESQVAGVYTITSDYGALATTNMVQVIPGDPASRTQKGAYIEKAREFLALPVEARKIVSTEICNKAIERFNPTNILKQWNEEVFQGI